MKKILIINGPNLNMLGKREPDIYGSLTLEEIIDYTSAKITEDKLKAHTDWFQSNIESELIEKIHSIESSKYEALVINPAAYSHTSVALLDALKLVKIPIIEVHLSNTYKREEFRRQKITTLASTIVMEGLGKNAYYLAVKSQFL